jgi:putative ABC transport system ATP-binding protein
MATQATSGTEPSGLPALSANVHASGVVIRAHDLWRTYVMGAEEIHALRGVSFEVPAGEYLAVMGPSGSGKSTLMNIIGCLDTPTRGTYELRGKLVSEMTDDELAAVRNREIGFVFQTFNLLPRASALHNVELPLIRQRVAIARALVMQPSLLLADEPTGNLDTATGEEIMRLFERLHEQGHTIILVTHERDIAQHAHRTIFIRDGQIASDERRR